MKLPDKQLNLTRSSVKNKLFEITKEFKDFKFQQSLGIEYNEILTDPQFDSGKIQFNINIDELLNIQHNQLSSKVERWTYEGSG